MKPGDLVVLVNGPEEKLDDSLHGLHGVIVEQVTLEDGHPINSWCDWWVLIDGELQPWANENLRLINDIDDGYNATKERE
jgi:hypothetical protein